MIHPSIYLLCSDLLTFLCDIYTWWLSVSFGHILSCFFSPLNLCLCCSHCLERLFLSPHPWLTLLRCYSLQDSYFIHQTIHPSGFPTLVFITLYGNRPLPYLWPFPQNLSTWRTGPAFCPVLTLSRSALSTYRSSVDTVMYHIYWAATLCQAL